MPASYTFHRFAGRKADEGEMKLEINQSLAH
jgi:hypothetical protein